MDNVGKKRKEKGEKAEKARGKKMRHLKSEAAKLAAQPEAAAEASKKSVNTVVLSVIFNLHLCVSIQVKLFN